MAHILDVIVARKKEEITALKKNGVQIPEPFIDKNIPPPRGFRKALIDYHGVAISQKLKKHPLQRALSVQILTLFKLQWITKKMEHRLFQS